MRLNCRQNAKKSLNKPTACADRHLLAFADRIGEKLGQGQMVEGGGSARQAVVDLVQTRYRSQMIQSVAQKIVQLINRGVAPGEIAVVAPHADGVLRFMLAEAFRAADIPFALKMSLNLSAPRLYPSFCPEKELKCK